jgi:hypothetical protein
MTVDMMVENLQLLEMSMEDEGWRKLGIQAEREFTRRGLDQLIRVSRAMYLSHPLVKRGVNVTTYYTWAQGVTMQAKDQTVQDEIVLPTMDDDANRQELYGYQARILTDVDQMNEGNVFIVMFTNMNGDVSVRSIPTNEITEIMSREGDGRILTYYRRVWSESSMDLRTATPIIRQKEEFYPDWRYHPDNKPDTVAGIKVNWDAPIIHQKTGGLKNMRFGIPETYAAFEWARAYKSFLEDWHTLVNSLSRFAFKATTKGKKIQRLKEKLESEGKRQTQDEAETDLNDRQPRRRKVGDVYVGKEGDDIQAIPKSGATISSDDARPSRLMIASAMDLPDTILSGDVDVGNFATSKTLDRPTELAMLHRQTLWSDFHKDIFRYCIDAKVRALELPGKQEKDPRTELNIIVPSFDSTVEVTFPPILEDDKAANINAIVAAATLQGKANAEVLPPELVSKMLLESLGVEDVDATLDELPEPEAAQVEEALNNLTEAIRAAAA